MLSKCLLIYLLSKVIYFLVNFLLIYFLIIFNKLLFFSRFVWNFFRLENEHLNNCGEFRAVRDISVAPIDTGDQQKIIKMMDEKDGYIYHLMPRQNGNTPNGSNGGVGGVGGTGSALKFDKQSNDVAIQMRNRLKRSRYVI